MMALNKRERNLAVVTTVLIALVAGKFLFSAWRGPLNRLRAERANLQKEVEQKEDRVARSVKAQARLDELDRRSLPADPKLARSLYYNWLFKLADEVGFSDPKVDAAGDGRKQGEGGAYRVLRFTVKAEASLDELTEFLYKFYSVDHLHQIHSLTIEPIERSSDLNVRLGLEALCLPGAETPTVDAVEGSFATVTGLTPDLKTELVYTGNDEKLADAAKLKLAGGKKAVELSFKGTESLEEVLEAINAQTAKSGVVAKLDGNRLHLRTKAPDADASSPRLAASELDVYREAIAKRNVFAAYKPPAPVREERPEPEPPKFDPCKFAYLTGIVKGLSDEPEVWLIARTTGTKYTLREGETFEVGDVSAKVIHINRRDAEIEFDGKRWLVPMGDNLREAKPLFEEPPEKAEVSAGAGDAPPTPLEEPAEKESGE
ncbi:MAG TPA: flagellin hook IN motif-containing protein [Thermoguttaceae bacterium]|nr:flagellin hook IN motif-containing protein [Thermoguttaceae bacterium]